MPSDLQHKQSLEKLKEAIRNQVFQNLNINKDFSEWSMADIYDFQEDLRKNCGSTVSEKWIYLHFKNNGGKLPRIDVLNLLARYCGFKNWDQFIIKIHTTKKSKSKTFKTLWLILLLPIVMAFPIMMVKNQPPTITIRFKNAYTRNVIPLNELSIKGLKHTGSKNSTYAINITNPKPHDSILIDGPYFKAQYIKLSELLRPDTLDIDLYPDDYALMLNYFSRSKSPDIDSRQHQLKSVIHRDAKIFQVHPKYDGVEILNRTEFIDRLTLPVNTLKSLEILHIEYKEEKIFRLRFVQKLTRYD